jgi:hypothetical protein
MTPPKLYPAAGYLHQPKYTMTGEKRAPKRGEFYLSGAIPEVYRAPNDLTTPYYIMREATPDESICQHCGRPR